jgi:hypothetical protein
VNKRFRLPSQNFIIKFVYLLMVCKYILTVGDNKITFDSEAEAVKYIRENQLSENLAKKTNPQMNTSTLADVLRQMSFGESIYNPSELRGFQIELLDKYTKLEDQSAYFYKAGSPISLTKGLGKSFEQFDNVRENLADLGIEEFGGEYDASVIPFDARYLLTGNSKYKNDSVAPYYHNITANNIRILGEIDSLSRTMFMERTPSFINIANKLLSNVKTSLLVNNDRIKELKDELAAFTQIAAYKELIAIKDKKTSTLRNSLIYDTNTDLPNIVDIVKEATKLAPNNTFLQFILPVSTTVKVGKKQQKNIANKDLINTVEGKTRGKLEPDMVSSLMDSFAELYQNPKTQFHAKALFDYLIVKDGLMFKNKSFIRMLPTFMFLEMSEATDTATRLMSANTLEEFKKILKDLDSKDIVDREGNFVEYFTAKEKEKFNTLFREKDITKIKDELYKKIFGLNYNDFYSKFQDIYATDIRNQFNLELVSPRVLTHRGTYKIAESVKFYKDEKGINFLHINLFTEKYKALEKGSDERKNMLGQIISETEDAGFPVSSKSIEDKKNPENNRIYLEFKSYVRIRGKQSYQLFKLVSVSRDNKNYSGHAMFPIGENVARGTSAVYEQAQTEGTSNSTGVANLEGRPKIVDIKRIIAAKIKKTEAQTENKQNPTKPITEAKNTAGESTNPETPPQVKGGIFGGFEQLPYDENMGDSPLGFFSDEQTDDEPC